MSSPFEYYVRFDLNGESDEMIRFVDTYRANLNYTVLPANKLILIGIKDQKLVDFFLLQFGNLIDWDR